MPSSAPANTEIYTFPYTTLFRSGDGLDGGQGVVDLMTENADQPLPGLPFLFTKGPAYVGEHQELVRLPLLTEGPAAYLPPSLGNGRSEEHTSELQSRRELVCRLLLRRTPRSTPFPTRRSSDLATDLMGVRELLIS